jgi:hypothetical protein
LHLSLASGGTVAPIWLLRLDSKCAAARHGGGGRASEGTTKVRLCSSHAPRSLSSEVLDSSLRGQITRERHVGRLPLLLPLTKRLRRVQTTGGGIVTDLLSVDALGRSGLVSPAVNHLLLDTLIQRTLTLEELHGFLPRRFGLTSRRWRTGSGTATTTLTTRYTERLRDQRVSPGKGPSRVSGHAPKSENCHGGILLRCLWVAINSYWDTPHT